MNSDAILLRLFLLALLNDLRCFCRSSRGHFVLFLAFMQVAHSKAKGDHRRIRMRDRLDSESGTAALAATTTSPTTPTTFTTKQFSKMDTFSDEEDWTSGEENAASLRDLSKMSDNYSNASPIYFSRPRFILTL